MNISATNSRKRKNGHTLDPCTEIPAKPTIEPTSEPQISKTGDTRMVDGQKEVYFLRFGWIDDNDEPNVGTYAEDMYENGNKIGITGGVTFVDGDGDINKMVGTMN
ncbi:MAG: DUF6550 family protein [Angelakisella sp.]|nr:DUF6550 family protein [Angelakisella sp.]